MTDLIGLSGYARTGKDTIAGILANYGYQRVAFADAIRAVALESDPIIDCGATPHTTDRRLSHLVHLNGWDHAKTEYPDVRRYLQRLGCALNEQRPGIWIEIAMRNAADIIRGGGHVVLADVRFPAEAEATRRVGQLWRIERAGCGPVNEHVTETALDGQDFDATLHNDGSLDDLRAVVHAALTTST